MKRYPLIYCFGILIALITVFDMSNKDKIYSELENRKLKGKTEFSLKKFYEGSFQDVYEEYINDQFVLRDNWITLKSISENVLGKLENNNIIYGENDYLFEKFINVDERRLEINIESINKFIESTDSNVTTMIVPNSYEIYKDYVKLPINLINQEEKLSEIYKNIKGSKNINLIEVMKSEKDNDLYYKTDHHWTTYGAYIAYKEYMKNNQYDAINLDDYKEIVVDDFFGTYYSKSKKHLSSGDKLTYYDFDEIIMKIGDNTYHSLYDYSKLETRDKYEMFLYGNNALTVVKNNSIEVDNKLLIVKDSYANSMVPFLTQNYKEIHIIDLRTFSSSVKDYVKDNDFDNILIIYNLINFTRESSVAKIKW